MPVLIDTGSEAFLLSPTAAAWLTLLATGQGWVVGIMGQVERSEIEGL